MTVDDEIKAGMRRLVLERGYKVRENRDIFRWMDHDAAYHILGQGPVVRKGKNYGRKQQKPCHWILPDNAVVDEVTYFEFDGTFTDSKPNIGLNVEGCRCACGKYKDVTLRVEMRLSEAIQTIIGYDPAKRMEM